MRDFTRETVDEDARERSTNFQTDEEVSFPNVPRTLEELRDEQKAEEFVSSVRHQLSITGPIDTRVYRNIKIDNEGYLYYKDKRVSVKGGKSLLSVKTIGKNKEGKEFLSKIGYTEQSSRVLEEVPTDPRSGNSVVTEESRDLETVAPEQTESIKSKIRSFKITEEWARKEREKATKELQRTTDENEKKNLKQLIDYYDQMEIQAKRRYNEVVENQFKRINEIIRDESISLHERLRELFRRDLLTIGAIITAIGMTISTIVLAFLLGQNPSDSGGPSASQPSQNRIATVVKRFLTKLANWLLDMAKMALSALPSAIGSLIAFLFKKAAELVLFLSEHLIIFFLALVLFAWEATKNMVFRR